jgi:hypothetical protein
MSGDEPDNGGKKPEPEDEDAGETADGPAEPEGSSGAEEGLSPWAPESYDPEGEGPTTSTEDP